ncbi:MAG: hypothetical protein KDD45_08745 [Bdellovibrionales bacterium]|nr:hypothetical protein [Bdellovibrionales bacterium]
MGFKFFILLVLPLFTFANANINFQDTYIQKNSEYQRRLIEHKKFENVIFKVQKQCPNLNCQNTIQAQTVYLNTQSRGGSIPYNYMQTFNQRVNELTQNWGDTILEADYIVTGQPRIDSIQTVSYKNKVLAFKVVYSMKAYSLAQCPQGTRNPYACPAGRIYEGSFVSPDFNHAVIDSNQVARFYRHN